MGSAWRPGLAPVLENSVMSRSGCAGLAGILAVVLTAGEARGQGLFNPVNGHFYAWYGGAGLPWHRARLVAEAMGGRLVTINDVQESAFVTTHLTLAEAWIGLSDEASEGTFAWVDGSPVAFTSWSGGEPNNSGDEDGVVILPGGSWNDLGDWNSRPFIIEGDGPLGSVSGVATSFADDFSPHPINPANPWIVGPEWQFGYATASGGHSYGGPDPGYDCRRTPGSSGGGVLGVVIGGNAAPVAHGFSFATTPVIPLPSGGLRHILSFQRWLNSDFAPYMVNVVDAWNGSAWANLWTSGGDPGLQDSRWTFQSFDVSAHANAGFRVRFGFATQSGVFTVSSWNIDDLVVTTFAATPPVPTLFLYTPGAPGTIGVRNYRCTGGPVAFTAFTTNPGAPFGWFFGLPIAFADLAAQAASGVPPFVSALDPQGASVFELLSPLPTGITFHALTLVFDAGGQLVNATGIESFTT